MDDIIGYIISVGCVVLGWFLSECTASLREKPKISFAMCSTPEVELTEKEYRTKTSPSEYSIEIFNTGKEPIILESFSMDYKEMTIPVSLFNDDRVIKPYHSVKCVVMQQDADTLLFYCEKYEFKKCKITAYDINGKIRKSKLELPLIHLRASFAKNNDIVY